MGKDITDRIAREENEADKKLGKKILGAAAAVPAGLAGLGASAMPGMPGPIDSAIGSAKIGYNSITGDKKGVEKAAQEMKDAVKRNQSIERKKDSGENTNPAGDTYKRGGSVRSSASRRADGCAIKGKTKGRMV